VRSRFHCKFPSNSYFLHVTFSAKSPRVSFITNLINVLCFSHRTSQYTQKCKSVYIPILGLKLFLYCAGLQTSGGKYLRSALFWVITQWVVLISGFCWEVSENCALLGYYTMSSADSLLTFRESLSVPSSRSKNSLEGGTNILSRNVGKGWPLYVSLNPRIGQMRSCIRCTVRLYFGSIWRNASLHAADCIQWANAVFSCYYSEN
jgi:hypothetical protein